ncbi:hypothetical protein GCM10010392_61900 [Streptomyces clavifer]|nr:hypothetical protein GCM10010392_61900 [Streptomyces clavifer]
MTDHMRPNNHTVTAAMTRTRSNSPETRADTRRAARVLVELNVKDMGVTLWAAAPSADRPHQEPTGHGALTVQPGPGGDPRGCLRSPARVSSGSR